MPRRDPKKWNPNTTYEAPGPTENHMEYRMSMHVEDREKVKKIIFYY